MKHLFNRISGRSYHWCPKSQGVSSSNALYHEWVPVRVGIIGKMFLVTLFSISIVVVVYALTILTVPIRIGIVFLMTAGIVPLFLILRNFRGLSITITTNELRVKYGAVNQRRILRDNIVNCKIAQASLRRYGGLGVRIGTDRSRAYLTSVGPAVMIETKHERPFLFSSEHPERICEAIASQNNNESVEELESCRDLLNQTQK